MQAFRHPASDLATAFLAVWLVFPATATAEPVLDQQTVAAFPIFPDGSIGVVNLQCCLWAQTLTVGISGQLTTLDVMLGNFPDVRYDIELRQTTGGVPGPDDGSVLAQLLLVTPQDFGTFSRFDVSPLGFAARAGDVLSLSLRSHEMGSWIMFANDVPGTVPYLRGAAFQRHSAAHPWTPIVGTTWDFSLRTFVDPAVEPVPEPTTIVLIATGVLAVGRRACRRRRQHATRLVP